MNPRFRRRMAVVVALACAAFVVAYVVQGLRPKQYQSQALVSVTVSGQVLSTQQVTNQLFANLPTPPALAQAFTQLISTRALTAALGTDRPDSIYAARFDERKALLTLQATGGTPAEAKQRAEKLLAIAQSNLQDRLADAARANALSALEQARIDTKTAARILEDLQKVLNGAPRGAAAPGVAAGLEGLKVDPAVARAPSPAFTYLSLQASQQETSLAQARGRAEALESVLNESDALRKLVGQALQVQVLAPPAEPLDPIAPRPFRYAAFAALAALGLGTILLLLADASEDAQSPTA